MRPWGRCRHKGGGCRRTPTGVASPGLLAAECSSASSGCADRSRRYRARRRRRQGWWPATWDAANSASAVELETTHTADTERNLYSLAAQASWLFGWLCYDSGLHAAAQRYYLTALRASATAGDALTGANTLAFQAIQIYTVGNPHDAVDLMHTARATIHGRSTPKTVAILHAREARALSKINDHQRCYRASAPPSSH